MIIRSLRQNSSFSRFGEEHHKVVWQETLKLVLDQIVEAKTLKPKLSVNFFNENMNECLIDPLIKEYEKSLPTV